MGIDETRQYDRAATIDLARVHRADVRSNSRDLGAVDQNVRIQVFPDGGIHRNDDRISNDSTVHFDVSPSACSYTG
jgi:hypothetical protein